MIEKIKKLFKDRGLIYKTMINYNSDYYIAYATDPKNEMDPFYSVNKKDFSIAHFSPMHDPSIIGKFAKILEIDE